MVKSYEITSFSSHRQHNISNTVREIFQTRCLKYYKHGEDVGNSGLHVNLSNSR